MATNPRPVQYKGDDLDPEKGPGLGCFRFQLIVLAIFVVLTPLTVVWQWPEAISSALLIAVVILLLVTGQTIIFLLRLVAADRRSRRRPLGSATRTVGELEDATGASDPSPPDDGDPPPASTVDGPPHDGARLPASGDDPLPTDDDDTPPSDEGAVRQ